MAKMAETHNSTLPSQESLDQIEMNIAKDAATFGLPAAGVLAVVFAVFMSSQAAIAVAFAGILVVINLFIAATLMRISARFSSEAMMMGALGGFVVRLVIVFVCALVVRNMEILDFKVWLLSVAIGHIALLSWETYRVSFSLAHPGVKPKKNY